MRIFKLRRILFLLSAVVLLCASCQKDDDSVEVTSITITPAELSIKVGEKSTPLTVTIEPQNATDKTVTWNSSAPAVADIDGSTREVTAKTVGTTIITATANGKTAECKITVAENVVEVTSVTIIPAEFTIKAGEKSTPFTVTVEPQDATNKTVTWTSSTTDVADINVSTGEITAKAVGTTTITATAINGKTATCEVTVTGIVDLGDGSDAYEIKSNQTLTYPNTYILKGFVYVTSGTTLTIEPGVIIRGDKASKGTLIVERGGKIIAEGTAELPIVFTSNQATGSRKPGDWGGLILLGKAPNNAGEQTIEGGVRSKHGGNEPHDNSGTLKYVRVEFAGIEYSPDNEINGITFGSVGDATVVEYVQVSHSGDDSFEWFGGTVNANHLIAYHGWDDDFDTDNGFSGKIQFALDIRDPEIGDKSASNGFESDNNSAGSAIEPYTGAVFANVSLFGPVSDPANYTDRAGVNGSTVDARFQAGLHLRRNTQLNIFNSVITAFPIGIIIENDKGSTTQQWATDGKLNIANCYLAGTIKNFQNAQYWKSSSVFNPDDDGSFIDNYFNRSGGGNHTATLADLKLSGNYYLASGSPLATGADWTNAKISSGFEKVAYHGAFGPNETKDSNWTTGWANFDPQNTVY
ncbi:MAG: Ig-like domain-containing protein [Prevotellaceae bacterium]|jgi:hypothetical protein|nr:Ig-like domain-containing protein [Prevotellaceae bacterium]